MRSKEKRLYSQGKSNDKAVKEKQIQRKFCLGVLKFLQGAGGFFHLPLSRNFGGNDKTNYLSYNTFRLYERISNKTQAKPPIQ